MERAAESRTVQGFIRMMSDSEAVRWMDRLPVPSASIGAYDPVQKVNAVVDVDFVQLAKSGVESLAAQGCRSVGYIFATDRENESGRAFDRQFVKSARQAGLRVEEAWMRERPIARGGYAFLDYGYDEFLKVVEMAEHPDGLLIWHDMVAEGVLTAVATRRIRVPEEIKLVLHRNEGHRYNCPLPVTYAVTREREIALALIEHLEKQLAGEACVPALIPFHLVPSVEMDASPHRRP
jgi:DNA-binding LacI/PurR family transcriptional regulator